VGERGEAQGAPYPVRRDRHVFVIVFENHAFDQVLGNPEAPYFSELARLCGLATDYDALTHPSLPNYIALMSGGLNGITTNCTECHTAAPSLADQLEAASLTWKTYAEAMPEPCFPGAGTPRYVKRHNPFLYFDSIRGNSSRCRRSVVPLTQLDGDLASGDVPNFSLIVPDMCHNMHDCTVADGDTWLRGFLPTILRSRTYQQGGIVVVTFDEGSGKSNQIPTFVMTPGMRPNTRCGAHQDHYSMLRTLEDLFGLPPLGAATQRTSMLRCFLLPEPSPAP
jgi:phosphatidylinositol-3-phosphatase